MKLIVKEDFAAGGNEYRIGQEIRESDTSAWPEGSLNTRINHGFLTPTTDQSDEEAHVTLKANEAAHEERVKAFEQEKLAFNKSVEAHKAEVAKFEAAQKAPAAPAAPVEAEQK